MNKLYKKLLSPRILERIYLERLGEPVIYKLVSIFVLFFGNIQQKIKYDLIPRQSYAYGLDLAFSQAQEQGQSKIIIVEFGVASGAGLYNLASIAEKLSEWYSIDYQIYGFDTGQGMPPPLDYRDHPEKYRTGDFPPLQLDKSKLPSKTEIIYGAISETTNDFLEKLDQGSVIGFVSIDVDYYSSTVDCLTTFLGEPGKYLPSTVLYFDDVNNIDHNRHMGELLAIEEFNAKQSHRKICKINQLRNWRVFKNALWLDQVYFLHVLDSDFRLPDRWVNEPTVVLPNPYL